MIPAATIGDFQVRRTKGRCELLEKIFTWMIDDEEDQRLAIDNCVGKVLIGGLGLGVVVEALNEKDSITGMVVVEKSPEVIKLVWKYLKTDKARIIQADVFDYIETTDERFDYVYFDVHRHPLKDTSEIERLAGRVTDKVLIWGG